MTKSPTRRAYVETYGCQMNIADGELMEGILEGGGYAIVASPEEADVVLVNTCAIREHAERRVLGRVAQLHGLKLERPDVVIGVTGCMAQRMGDDLLTKAPYVDLVMGPDGYRSLPERLRALESGEAVSEEGSEAFSGQGRAAATGTVVRPRRRAAPKARIQLAVVELDTSENYEGLEQRREKGPSAWVPIQRGCDHRCTFCIVPYVRGPEKNRAPGEIVGEIRTLVERGVSEVTLLGQTVNSYRDGDWSFPRLLEAVARIDGIRRVRFTSPHPNDVTPELVEVMATEPAVCEQLHLPAQSGSDRILKRMARRYTVEEYLSRVELVRSAIPDIALSTDIIVGFPSETEEEFEDTLDLMRTVRFDDAFTYRYSPRDGTPSTRMPREWRVPEPEAQRRLETLIDVARGIQAEINRGEVGREERVLVERAAKEPGQVLGRTRRHKAVVFDGEDEWIGSYRTVRLERTTGTTFAGSILEELAATH